MNLSDETTSNLLACIGHCEIFLTPNNRLAAQLTEILCELLPGSAEPVQETQVTELPTILPYEQWADQLYQRAQLQGQLPADMLLTDSEQRALWREVISQHQQWPAGAVLPSTIGELHKAFNQLDDALLDIDVSKSVFDSLPDSRLFRECAESFKQLLGARGLITRGQARRRLLELDHHSQSQSVALVGFEKLTQLQQALLDQFAKLREDWRIDLHVDTKQLCLAYVELEKDELAAAIHWAWQKQCEQPQARVAVIVKDLAQKRCQVQRIAHQLLVDEGRVAGLDSGELNRFFNISMGTPLLSTAVVGIAQKLLQSFIGPVTVDDWLALFNSPYTMFANDYCGLADQLLRAMYSAGEKAFEFSELAALAEWYQQSESIHFSESEMHALAALTAINKKLRTLHRKKHQRQAASLWLDELFDVIAMLQWPQLGRLQSVEYQQYQALQKLRLAFRRFDQIQPACTITEAVSAFFSLCRETLFQAETLAGEQGRGLPQVLGLLEGAGQCFDALWVTGMGETQWPQPLNPNAFIPLSLQIQYQMPAASVESELAYAQMLTKNLLRSASQVLVSSPRVVDEVETRLSQVVEESVGELLSERAGQLNLSRSLPEQTSQQTEISCTAAECSMELIADNHGKPWQANCSDGEASEKAALPGGTAVLRNMANNPLQAYASHRLGIESIWPPQPGIRPYERGNVVHAVLETFWREVGDSQTLQAMPEADRRNRLLVLIEKYLGEQLGRRYREPNGNLATLEKEALCETLLARLVFELSYPAFSVIALEERLQMEFANCVVKGRLDRIDSVETSQGSQLLVADYKTSVASVNWDSDPLYEPQLPFYLLALREQSPESLAKVDGQAVLGVYQAIVRPGYIRNTGLIGDATLEKSYAGFNALENETEWQELIEQWRMQLADYVALFVEGYAGFDPDLHNGDERYRSFTRHHFAVSESSEQADSAGQHE